MTKQTNTVKRRVPWKNHPKDTPTPETKCSVRTIPSCWLFRTSLRDWMGGKKESEVYQITADLNKHLKFARPKSDDPVWLDLLDEGKVSGYLDTPCKRLGPEGQLGRGYMKTTLLYILYLQLYHALELEQQLLTSWFMSLHLCMLPTAENIFNTSSSVTLGSRFPMYLYSIPNMQ